MVGETQARTFLRMIQVSDPDPVVNTVTVSYMDTFGESHTDTDTAEVDLVHPAFTVSVECLFAPVPPGEDAEFQVLITNTGDVDLIVCTDDLGIPVFTLVVGDVFMHMTHVECVGDQACHMVNALATLPAEFELPNEYAASDMACCPCGVNPVEENTWGRVKSLFRSEAGD